jgi:dynein heavy chain 1
MCSRAASLASAKITTSSVAPKKRSISNRLHPVTEELRDLKAVWTALSGIWNSLAQLREQPWSGVQPRKLRHELDATLTSTRDMPSRMRQYAAFEFVQDTIRSLLKANILISELKSEALRERHWSRLYKALRMPSGYQASG